MIRALVADQSLDGVLPLSMKDPKRGATLEILPDEPSPPGLHDER